MVRRSLRLDPPYWTAIVLMIAFSLVSARFVAGKAPPVITAPQMVAHVFYLQDILGYPSIGTVFWILCLEVQVYFIYVFLLLAGGRYRGIVLMSAAIISFAWTAGLVSDNVWPACSVAGCHHQ
jgi:peptidoglycan/LPS O-acetylase OafA/YrhL